MKITIDIDCLVECSSYASRSLGLLDFSKTVLDRMKDDEDWPEIEYDASCVKDALDTATMYLEQLCDTIVKAEYEA